MTLPSPDVPLYQLRAGECPVCGSSDALVAFSNETHSVAVGKIQRDVKNLAGERCKQCNEVFFDDASAQRFAETGDKLVMEQRKADGLRLRAVRQRLGLTQGEAGLLAGGGHNGFSRYETGQTVPVPAVWHLFDLLDKHPLMARELPGVTVTQVRNTRAGQPTSGKHKGVVVNGQTFVIRVNGHEPEHAGVDVGHLVAAKDAAGRAVKSLAKRAGTKKAAPRRRG